MSGLTSLSSLQVLLKETYGTLLDDKVKKLVLLVEPRVGKTWMARKLSDRAIREGKFELTLWVFLNRKYDYNALCESIARQLSLLPISEEWKAEDESRESNEYEADVMQKRDIKEKYMRIEYEIRNGSVYLMLVFVAVLNVLAFLVTKRRYLVYLAAAFTISAGIYLGFYRTQIRKKFSIRGNDSSLDDCIYHLICPCCSLCQESRTLEMNNVQDGTWHDRGNTICIGSYSEGSKAKFELSPPPVVSTKSPNSQSTTKATSHSNRLGF